MDNEGVKGQNFLECIFSDSGGVGVNFGEFDANSSNAAGLEFLF